MRGHISQRSPGSFTIQVSGGFDDAGRRVRATRTIRGNRTDAERALTRLLRDIDEGKVVRAGREMFAAYLTDRWLPHMRSRVSTETWTRYESLVRVHLVPRCGRVKLAALRPHHLQRALDGMLADGAATASVVKAHRLAAQALKQAVRWQLLPTSPADGVSPPRGKRRDLRIPTAEETRKLLDAAEGTPYAVPFLLAATTGMRRGEVVQLPWRDVDLDRRDPETHKPAPVLRIRSGKTDRARRTISLPPSTAAVLRRHRAEQLERRLRIGEAWHDTGLVVERGNGLHVDPDTLTHVFADLAESVGLADVRLHDLRHGFATTLLAAGVNVKVVSEALGHASTAFTMDCYAHVLPTMGEAVASAIETSLG